MDRDEIARLMEYWREEARRYAQNADYWQERAEAALSSLGTGWRPTREQIARTIDPTAFTELPTPPRGLEMVSTAVLTKWQDNRRSRALKQADAVLALTPEAE